MLTGSETITYHNRSPDTLATVVLRLEQNVYAAGARRNRRVVPTGGITVENLRVDGEAAGSEHPGSGYREALTLLTVDLPSPVPPGGTTRISLDFRFTVPAAPTFRQGNVDGELFGLAQWYPRVAVYDDIYGWDQTPYLGDGEFYLEYGDFDVSVTVPGGWVMGATGTLANPDEILSAEAKARLEEAATSGELVRMIEPGDGATSLRDGRPATWRFIAENVRDFAWATCAHYAWDARSVAVRGPDGGEPRTVLAHALYRPGLETWREQAVDLVAHTLTEMSGRVGVYPYPQLTIVEGPTRGMEYPMIVFGPSTDDARRLAGVTIHESAHQWFPMVVGTMEAKHAWMDEGIVSYWRELVAADLGGEPPPAWGKTQSYLRVAGTEEEVPLMRHTDLVSPYGARSLAASTKPAVVLGALRATLGEEAFLAAFRDFYESWRFHHPQPWDFFATFERHAEMDLDWFWRPLFFETDVLDQAVIGVQHNQGRSRVMLRDVGNVVLPTPIEIEMAGGTLQVALVTAGTWIEAGRRHDLVLSGEVVRVTLDPDGIYPDVDRSNNEWTAGSSANRSELR